MRKTTLAVMTSAILGQSACAEGNITEAILNGGASADLNLHYESVKQDNTLQDATALTLRTRLGYTTAAYRNAFAMIEMEDVRSVGGQDGYSLKRRALSVPGSSQLMNDAAFKCRQPVKSSNLHYFGTLPDCRSKML